MEIVTVKTEFIKLEAVLKLAGWCDTGGQAKIRIQLGDVKLNGKQCLQRGKKCRDGDVITMGGKSLCVKAAVPEQTV